ncbi:MAG: glycosyltransferase [Bacteroidaceae bacterium]|nr:glycosyltransferase [Bacteroidaceae bacterium]
MKRSHLYLIDEVCKGSKYGVNSYMALLQGCTTCFDKVTAVVLSAEKKDLVVTEEAGIQYIYIPHLSQDKESYYRRCFYVLSFYVNQEEVNVAQFNYLNSQELSTALKEKLGFKIVLTWHYNYWKDWIETANLLHLLRMSESELAVQPEVEKIKRKRVEESGRMLKDYDKIITVCQESYDELQQVYGLSATQLALIHNPVKPLKGRNDYVAPDKKNIICVGRIDHNKNVELLVEAFIELRKKRDDIRLLIVGGGVYDNAISRIGLNYQDICFTGMLNKEQLEEVYQNAHVGVTLSWHEEGPLVALEMMQHGIPVIGSRTGILPELIEDGRNGYLVDLVWRQNDFNIQPVVERLEAVLSAPDYMQMRQYAIDSVDERFSYELFKEKMTRLYEELLNRD